MFEAHNVIRESLEHRVSHHVPKPSSAFLMDLMPTSSNDPTAENQRDVAKLYDIAKAKCDHMTRQIVDIAKMHVNTNFFEWDASLVRGEF